MNLSSSSSPSVQPFPFSALIGQDALRQALLLAAIDPGIGGVLVCGPRGTAKSTAARALAELLPEGRLVTLPLGASEERLIGSLDLDEALRGGAVKFAPGLLAQAHGGVLYVDEVNLLADALVDAMLDAAASGVNTVERDGVSHRHEARFVLIGTMNPEEGELRPQLLDRFGLMVELENCFEPQARQQIVKARLAFDLDAQAFRARYEAQQSALIGRLRAARARLPMLSFDDAVHEHVSQRCIDAAVDGMRADLVMLRAARALAALEQADGVTVAHVERVADAVLKHRRHDAGHGSQHGGDDAAGQTDRGSRPSTASQNAAPEGAAAASGPTPAITDGTDDWGYLPPEPAGIVAVKGVVPLSAKKR